MLRRMGCREHSPKDAWLHHIPARHEISQLAADLTQDLDVLREKTDRQPQHADLPRKDLLGELLRVHEHRLGYDRHACAIE